MGPLKNNRPERFADAILDGQSATAAYRSAGYKSDGHAAEACASKLLRNVDVAARIAELKAKAAEVVTLTAANVLSELRKLAFANILDYVTIDGEGQPRTDFSGMTRDQAAAVGEITVETRTEQREDAEPAVIVKTRFKLCDKRAALVDLGRHFRLFPTRAELTGKNGGPIKTTIVPPPLTPPEVAARVKDLLRQAEVEVSLPEGAGSDVERVKAIVGSGEL